MKDQFEKEVCSKCKSWEDNQCNETFYYSKYYQCYSEYLEQKLEQAENKIEYYIEELGDIGIKKEGADIALSIALQENKELKAENERQYKER